MALQFHCVTCGTRVRVRHLEVGEMAKCPSCGGLTRVPKSAADVPSDSDFPAGPSAPPDSFATQFSTPSFEKTARQSRPLTEDEQVEMEGARKQVEKAVRVGWIIVVLTALMMVLSLIRDNTGVLANFDLWNTIDIAVVLAIIFAVKKYSRTGAVMFIVFYAGSIAYEAITSSATIWLGLVFLGFIIQGARGVFVVNRLWKATGRPPDKISNWITVPLYVVVPLVPLSIVLGILMSAGLVPDTKVLAGDELSTYTRSQLEEAGIVESGELIHYFYSDAALSFTADGNLFTDSRVISYEENDTAILLWEAGWEDIYSIDVMTHGDEYSNTIIEVTTFDRTGFRLLASTEDGLDSVFYQKMLEVWNQKRDPNPALPKAL